MSVEIETFLKFCKYYYIYLDLYLIILLKGTISRRNILLILHWSLFGKPKKWGGFNLRKRNSEMEGDWESERFRKKVKEVSIKMKTMKQKVTITETFLNIKETHYSWTAWYCTSNVGVLLNNILMESWLLMNDYTIVNNIWKISWGTGFGTGRTSQILRNCAIKFKNSN